MSKDQKVTSAEQQGLQRAIERALEKEAKANGTWVDPSLPKTTVQYVAQCKSGRKVYQVKSANLDLFKRAVRQLQAEYPKMPITLFEVTIKRKVLS